MGFWSIFLDSLVLLKKQPKLFLPKMAIAFLYGFLMVLVINLLLLVLSLQPSIEAGIAIDPYMLFVILTGCLVVLILLAIVPLLDVLTNAMYPTLVKEFWEKKKILFMDAIKPIKGKLLRLFFSVLFIETILAIPFSLMLSFFYYEKDIAMLAFFTIIFLAFYLVLSAFFYFVYPIAVFDSVFFLKNFSRSFHLSRKKFGKILFASFVPFFVTIANFAIAFLALSSQRIEFWALFFLLRFLVALIQTYHMVLNPSIFLKYKEF